MELSEFKGRKYELSELERLYKTGTFQFVIMYGRRRVGKSTILARFTAAKRTIFFAAIESASQRNLELFSAQVMSLRNVENAAAFPDWERAFDETAALADKPLILVIDEFPYLAQAERSISSVLQHYCDKVFSRLPIMIILCGSSMSFMENQVLGYQSPLYGRRTAQFKIDPLKFEEAAEFVPAYSPEKKAVVFGITGGIPKYLELFSDSRSLKENIIRNFLLPAAYLFEEPSNLLKQELREPATYNLIIEAVAKGATRLNEIASKTRMDSGAISNYIASLISLGIVRKESAVTEETNKRKTLYRLADTMFVFWYRYVFGSQFSILSGDAESLYAGDIEPDINAFMGPVFETICAQYLSRLNASGKLPLKIRQMGRWWGSNPKTKTEDEIDIIGFNEKESSALFCECKFRNQLLDASVLTDLKRKASYWKTIDRPYYALFSKSGFTKDLTKLAAEESNVLLFPLSEMYAG